MGTLGILSLSLLTITAADPQDKPAKKELTRLEGTWKYVKVEAPDKIADAIASVSVVEFRGTKMIHTITLSSGNKEVTEAMITLDPGKKPKTIDVMPLDGPEKGKTTKGIHELDDEMGSVARRGVPCG